MNRINLVPTYRIHASTRRSQIRLWSVLAAVYCCFISVIAVGMAVAFDTKKDSLVDELTLFESQIKSAEDAISSLAPVLDDAILALAASKAVAKQPDWSQVLGLISKALGGQNIVLRRCQLKPAIENGAQPRQPTYGGPVLLVRGLGQSQSHVSNFVLGLEQLRLFDRVEVVANRREPFLGGYAVGFELECLFHHEPGGSP